MIYSSSDKISATTSYGIIDVSWEILSAPFHYYVVSRVYANDEQRIATISPANQQYRFTIPLADRGEVITLRVFAYDVVDDVEYDVGSVRVETHPNPPTAFVCDYAFDYRVDLSWQASAGSASIGGYVVERSSDNGQTYAILGLAAIGHFIDIGNISKAPQTGKMYRYRISAMSASGLRSSMVTHDVIVRTKTIADIRTMVPKTVDGLPMGKYRIKAKSDDGAETRWVVCDSVLMPSTQPEYAYQYRIRARTVDGTDSLPVVHRSMLIANDYEATPTPRFRLRVVDVNGAESDAIVTELRPRRLAPTPHLVDDQREDIVSASGKKLYGRLAL